MLQHTDSAAWVRLRSIDYPYFAVLWKCGRPRRDVLILAFENTDTDSDELGPATALMGAAFARTACCPRKAESIRK